MARCCIDAESCMPCIVMHCRINYCWYHYTRVTVERCFGLLKGRWLRIGPAGGTLLYTPEKVCHIILACSVLHNIALVNGVPLMCRRCQDADLHLGKVSLLASVSSLHVRPQWARPPNQEHLTLPPLPLAASKHQKPNWTDRQVFPYNGQIENQSTLLDGLMWRYTCMEKHGQYPWLSSGLLCSDGVGLCVLQ